MFLRAHFKKQCAHHNKKGKLYVKIVDIKNDEYANDRMIDC